MPLQPLHDPCLLRSSVTSTRLVNSEDLTAQTKDLQVRAHAPARKQQCVHCAILEHFRFLGSGWGPGLGAWAGAGLAGAGPGSGPIRPLNPEL